MTERFRKSSYSSGGGQGSCVEVEVTKLAAVRDSKNPIGPVLRFEDSGTVARFLTAIKAGTLK